MKDRPWQCASPVDRDGVNIFFHFPYRFLICSSLVPYGCPAILRSISNCKTTLGDTSSAIWFSLIESEWPLCPCIDEGLVGLLTALHRAAPAFFLADFIPCHNQTTSFIFSEEICRYI
jgi:hypothetical protein